MKEIQGDVEAQPTGDLITVRISFKIFGIVSGHYRPPQKYDTTEEL